MNEFDLIVIGSGPAGEKGAAQAAWSGKRVALIEREPAPGGAGVNTGTIPSKTLRESALHLSGFRQRGFRDVAHADVTLDSFTHRERVVVDGERVRVRVERNLRRHDVEYVRGSASFVSPHAVRVGDRVLEADVVLIATGSTPTRPAHVPFDDVRICDSDSILRLTEIPKSLAVVGAGVIGCE